MRGLPASTALTTAGVAGFGLTGIVAAYIWACTTSGVITSCVQSNSFTIPNCPASSGMAILATVVSPTTAVVGTTVAVNFTSNLPSSSSFEFFNLVGVSTNYSASYTGLPPYSLNSGTPTFAAAVYGYTGAMTNTIPSIAGKTLTWYAEDCYSNTIGNFDVTATATGAGATCRRSAVAGTTMSVTASVGHRKLL